MSDDEKKNKWANIIVGPAIVVVGITALWKNENRFDYGRAAGRATVVASIDVAVPGNTISYTGEMDQLRSLTGHYVEAFSGYLVVWREAEIYAWDKDRRDDRTTWELRWMSSVESNSRNSGVRQQLSSTRLTSSEYEVGELEVEPQLLEFVDSTETIGANELSMTAQARQLGLRVDGTYLYLAKNASRQLGDERVRYSGIRIPNVATYFGLYQANHGVADKSHQRTGWINSLIRDTGILHHIVAGERSVALSTMRAHLRRLKWIVRGAGAGAIVLGFSMFFSTIVGFLFHLPVIGSIAESGVWILSIAIGVPLALVTIGVSYLVAHPLILVAIFAAVAGGVFVLRKRSSKSQQLLKEKIEVEYGHELSGSELKELEFIELVQIAMSDNKLEEKEAKQLKRWAKSQRWDQTKYDSMIDRAKALETQGSSQAASTAHLRNLVRLAMADGRFSSLEIRTIRRVSNSVGYDDKMIKHLIQQVRQELKLSPT